MSFRADFGAGVRLAPGSRAGFKECVLNRNTAMLHGPALAVMSGDAASDPGSAWLSSGVLNGNSDPTGVAISNSDNRIVLFSEPQYNVHVVDTNSTTRSASLDLLLGVEMRKRGFLVDVDRIEAIAKACR
jgi:hypothetical protein